MIATIRAWIGWRLWLIHDRIHGWILHLRKEDA